MRHLPKHQRAWVGVCVAVTLPFLVRDLVQLGTTPPILDEPLDPYALSYQATNAEAVIDGRVNLKLEEVRTVVGTAYPAWQPHAKTLPETPPTGHIFHEDALDRQRLPPDETMYRFAVSWAGDADEMIPVLIQSTPGTGAEKYVRIAYHGSNGSGRRGMSTWRAFPKGTHKADVDAGVAFASDTRTLAQFPVPGSLGISYGARAVWTASQDSYFTPVAVAIPENLRPSRSGTYYVKTYTIDRWGMETLADTRQVTLSPVTDSIQIPLTRLDSKRDAQAVRVTITPYHWARFADVPLSIPDENVARLNPVPITPDMKQKQVAVLNGSSGAVGDYHELLRVRHDALTHPQLAQFVPGAVTLTHSRGYLDSASPGFSRTETHLYAFVPGEWEATRQQLTLFAVTTSGKRVRAHSRESSSEGDGMRVHWHLSGVPYEDVAELSLGLTQ